MDPLTAIRFLAVLFLALLYTRYPKPSKYAFLFSGFLFIAAVISAIIAQIHILGVVAYTLFALLQFTQFIAIVKEENNHETSL